MIPLNIILAATLVNVTIDIYQIVGIFREFTGTYHFALELFKSGFSSLVMGIFIVNGLVKSPKYRKVRLLFLAILLMDLCFDVMQAIQSDGMTSAQMQDAMKQLPYILYYLEVLLPILVGCSIVLITAVSFQIKKPFYYQYPAIAPWQLVVMRIFCVLYYMETGMAIFLAFTLLLARNLPSST